MNLDDRIPLVLGHVGHHAIAQNAGIVDQNVELAELVDSLVDHALRPVPTADVVAVHNRLATFGNDFVGDLLCQRRIAAAAIDLGTNVVDDDLGAVPRQHQGMLAAEAARGTRDNGNPILTKPTHSILP